MHDKVIYGPAMKIMRFAEIPNHTTEHPGVSTFSEKRPSDAAIQAGARALGLLQATNLETFQSIMTDVGADPSGYQVFSAGENPHPASARGEVDAKVKKYMYDHPTVGYSEAAAVVLAADPNLKRAYAADRGENPQPSNGQNVRAEVDKKTRERMARTNEDYPKAMKAVLDSDRNLKTRYAKS